MPATPPHGPAISRRGILQLGAGAAVAAGLAATLSACTPGGAATGGAAPTGGGQLIHASVGGSTKDSIDAHKGVSWPDIARIRTLYEPLVGLDHNFKLVPGLAEHWESNADGTEWTFRLRDGLTFHNGKTVTADDVHASILRMIDPKAPAPYIGAIQTLYDTSSGAVDKRTYRLKLKSPFAIVDQTLSNYTLGIVPADYDPKNPVGTGAFKYQSFDPGQSSTFLRFDDYWGEVSKYEELVIRDFADDAARVSALLADQVQTVDNLPRNFVDQIERQGAHKLISKSGSWIPFTMRLDAKPFDDVRVRQAMRLIVDRKQMIDQALNGYGEIGNDLYSPFDPDYIGNQLPQREQDIDQAKFLLKQAGHEDLQVELTTSEAVGAGGVESANLFAQQAKKAGVDVKVTKVDGSVFFGDQYLSWPFAQSFYGTRNYIPQAEGCATSNAPFNETHFYNPTFDGLIKDAETTLDADKRRTLLQDAQEIEWNEGGIILWAFTDQVDAYSDSVTNVQESLTGPLTGFQFNTYVPKGTA